MTISYAIPVCNEFVEIQRLIAFLLENKRQEDEIVVLYDSNNGDKEVETYLRKMNADKTRFRWASYKFKGDFAEMKNRLNSMCDGDYIFQIDADEMVTEYILRLLPQILDANKETDLIRVPRINKVKGLTESHIQKWGWILDSKNRVNWPDMQWRIYRNDPRIRWHGDVHEKIIGHATHAALPIEEDFALIHNKTIERQEKQNNYYDSLQSKSKYVIFSPGYDPNSGGITILHKLCHMLNELGETSKIFPLNPSQNQTNPKWNTPLIDNSFNPENDIVIYPEIIEGNPLNAKKIVRYILNNPRPKEKQWGKNEFWLYHNKFFYNYTFDFKTNQSKFINEGSPDNYLHLIETRADFFVDKKLPRKGNCYTLRKGEEKGYKVDKNLKGAIEIKHNTSFEELKEIFNKTEKFYCYDTCTYISTIAALCGCISIVIPEKGLDKEMWRTKNPSLRYGIAYGEDDIPYALETLNKVRPYLKNLEDEMIPQLKEFIKKTKNYG